jgi:aminoglycoside phosphotransferase (APT) family kinase protein
MSVPGADPVRKGHELNISALEAYFRRNVPLFGNKIESLKQFASGQSNPTFYIKDDRGNEYVLRKKPSGQILPSAVRLMSCIVGRNGENGNRRETNEPP